MNVRRRLVVIKIGGGLTAIPGALESTCAAVAEAGRRAPIVVVPGGGPFADAVRAFDLEHRISPDASHWMAMLAMDQYAHVLTEGIEGAVLVEEAGAVVAAVDPVGVAVLAPSRWMRAADVLPHTWDATSDSVAAFVAERPARTCMAMVPTPPAPPTDCTRRDDGAHLFAPSTAPSIPSVTASRVLIHGRRRHPVGVESGGVRCSRSNARTASANGPARPAMEVRRPASATAAQVVRAPGIARGRHRS